MAVPPLPCVCQPNGSFLLPVLLHNLPPPLPKHRYDNEWGYSNRLTDLIAHMAAVDK